MEPSFPERALGIRRAAARLCLRLGWAPLHEVALPNGRRADILALRPDGCFACIEVKSGPRDFLTDLQVAGLPGVCRRTVLRRGRRFPAGTVAGRDWTDRRGRAGSGTVARRPGASAGRRPPPGAPAPFRAAGGGQAGHAGGSGRSGRHAGGAARRVISAVTKTQGSAEYFPNARLLFVKVRGEQELGPHGRHTDRRAGHCSAAAFRRCGSTRARQGSLRPIDADRIAAAQAGRRN